MHLFGCQTKGEQQLAYPGTITLKKVRGDDGPAGLFTKQLVDCDRMDKLLELFGCEFKEERSQLAPALWSGVGTTKGELIQATGAEASTRWAGWSEEEGKMFYWHC